MSSTQLGRRPFTLQDVFAVLFQPSRSAPANNPAITPLLAIADTMKLGDGTPAVTTRTGSSWLWNAADALWGEMLWS